MIEPNFPVFELNGYGLEHSGLSVSQAYELVRLGLLSFDPKTKVELAGYDIEELKFLKKIWFDSGLDGPTASKMIGKLKRPYRYSFDKIYWDFGTQDWKEIKLS